MNFVTSVFKKYMNKNENQSQKEKVPSDRDNVSNNESKKTKEGSSESSISEKINPMQHKLKDEDYFYDAKFGETSSELTSKVNNSSSQSIVFQDCTEYNGPPNIIEENADDFPDSLNNSINDSIDSETNKNFTESDYNIYDSIEVTSYSDTPSVINVNKLEDRKSLESIGADSLENLGSQFPKIIDNHDINETDNKDIGGNSEKDTKSDNNHKLVSLNDILFEPNHFAVKDCHSFKGNLQHIEAAQNFPSHVPTEQENINSKNKEAMINYDEENKATIHMIPKIETDNQEMLEIRVPEVFQENIHQKEVVSVVHEPTKKSIESDKYQKVLPNLLEDQLLVSTLTKNCNESNLDDSQCGRKLKDNEIPFSIIKPENEDSILLTKVLDGREKTDIKMGQLSKTHHKPSTVQKINDKESNDLSFYEITEVKENLIHIAESSHGKDQPFFDNNKHEWQGPREVQKLSDNEFKPNATQKNNTVRNVETNKTQVGGNLGNSQPENILEKSSNNTKSPRESTSNLTLSENNTALENGMQMITVDTEMTSEHRIISNNINSGNTKEGNECPNENVSKVNKEIELGKCIQKSGNTEDLKIDSISDNNIEFQKSPVCIPPITEHMVTMYLDSETGPTNSDKTDNIAAIENKPDSDILPSKLEVQTYVNQPVEECKGNILRMQNNDTMTGSDKDKHSITRIVLGDCQLHNDVTEEVTGTIIMNNPESTMEDVTFRTFSDERPKNIEKLDTNSEDYIQTCDYVTDQGDAVLYDSIEDLLPSSSNQNQNINIELDNQADNLGNMKTKESLVPIPEEESNEETHPFLDNNQYKWQSTSEFGDLKNESFISEEIDIPSSNKNENINIELINQPEKLGNMNIKQNSVQIPEESHEGTKLFLDNDQHDWQSTSEFEETRKYDTAYATETNQTQNIKDKFGDSKPEKIPESTNHDETPNQLLRDHSSSNELEMKNPGINGAKSNDIIGEFVDKKNETIKGNKSFESGETRKYDTVCAIETNQAQNIKDKMSDSKPEKIPENANHDETPNQLLRNYSSSNDQGMKNLEINGAKGHIINGECVKKMNEIIEGNQLSHNYTPEEMSEKILNSKQGIIGDAPLLSACAELAKEIYTLGTNDEEYTQTGDDVIKQSEEIQLDSLEKINKFSEKPNMTQLETRENPITVEQISQEYSVKKNSCKDCDKEKTSEMNEELGTKYPVKRFENLEQDCSRVNDAEQIILFNLDTHQSGIKTEIHELGSNISTDKMPESSIFSPESPDFNRQDTREFENLEKQCQEAVTTDDILNAILGANRSDKDTENRNVLKNEANNPILDLESDLERKEKNIFESTEFKAFETCPIGNIFLREDTNKNKFQEEQCGTDSLEQLDADIKSECDLNQKQIKSPRNITDTLYVIDRNNEEEISSEWFRLHKNDTNLSRNILQTSETDQGCIQISVVDNYNQSNIVDQETRDLTIAKSSGSSQNRVKNKLDKILVNKTSKVVYPEEHNELSDSIRGVREYDQKVVRSIDLEQATKLSKSVSGDNIDTKPVSKEGRSSKFDDVHEELKNKVDSLQQELSSIMKTKRKSQIDTNKNTEKNVILKYKNLLNEYEKRIGEQATDLEQLKMEAEQNVRHFTTTEMAFSDLFEKYEKAKYAITVYRRNEDVLLENIQNAEDQLSITEAKCRSMQQQSMQQIQWAYGQVEKEKKAYDKELSKLQSQVKRLEIKASSLERALKQKCDECQALASLCDDITGLNSTAL